MQLLLVFGILFAILAVMFALQNNAAVAVGFAFWQFESSLAVVLLLAVGLGVIIAGLVSSPTVIRDRWAVSRLKKRTVELEGANAALTRRVAELEAEVLRLNPAAVFTPEEPKPYVGFTEMLSGRQP
jgi:uncharacterized integral membrane protein